MKFFIVKMLYKYKKMEESTQKLLARLEENEELLKSISAVVQRPILNLVKENGFPKEIKYTDIDQQLKKQYSYTEVDVDNQDNLIKNHINMCLCAKEVKDMTDEFIKSMFIFPYITHQIIFGGKTGTVLDKEIVQSMIEKCRLLSLSYIYGLDYAK